MIPDEAAIGGLRRMACGEGVPAAGAVAALAATVIATWPSDFAGERDEALVGRRSPLSARDHHAAGLAAAAAGPHDASVRAARLGYHARWLLALACDRSLPGPSVSVVIPAYNRASLTLAAVESVLAQAWTDVEIVVVDDGSTDGTAEALSRFGPRIRLLRQANAGVSAARNAGIRAASGDFIQFLDSDNLLEPDCIAAKIAAFAAIPDARLCYCGATELALFGAPPAMTVWSHFPFDADNLATQDLMRGIAEAGYPFLVTSVMMPRWVALESGGFDTDMRVAEDARYWFRLGLAGVKAIGLKRRLFVRCIMRDGLNATNRSAMGPKALNVVRNVGDALASPEHWPHLANYLSRPPMQPTWRHVLDAGEADSLLSAGREGLLAAIRRLDDAPAGGPSPLPILLVVWLSIEAVPPGEGAAGAGRSFRDDLLAAVIGAAGRARAMTPGDRALWQAWSTVGPASDALRQRLAGADPLVASAPDSHREALAFLRACAGLPEVAATGPVAGAPPRPMVTIVLPVLGDPGGAEATIAGLLAGKAGAAEIIVVDDDAGRLHRWIAMSQAVRALLLVERGGDLASARTIGVQHATGWLVRLALPGDAVSLAALEAEAKALRAAGTYAFAVAVPARPDAAPRLSTLSELHAEGLRPPLSHMLFPLSLLRRIGGFDAAVDAFHEERYRLRLAASGVPALTVPSAVAVGRAAPGDSRPEAAGLAALADLALALDSPATWAFLPRIAQRARDAAPYPASGPLASVIARLLDQVERKIAGLAAGAHGGAMDDAALSSTLAALRRELGGNDAPAPEMARIVAALEAAAPEATSG